MVPKSTPITKRSPVLGVPMFRWAIVWLAASVSVLLGLTRGAGADGGEGEGGSGKEYERKREEGEKEWGMWEGM